MSELLNKLFSSLKGIRFPISNEKKTQAKIAEVLIPLGFKREHYLDYENIPDFFAEGIVVEIKIKGEKMPIYRQLRRYADFMEVEVIVLVTSRSMGLPKTIYGKPAYYINLSKSFL